MTILSGLGIVLSLVFGCLLMALVGELYYLLWWKKQRIINTPSNNIQEDYSTHAKEMFYLFCWDKPTPMLNNNTNSSNPNSNSIVHDTDIELGLGARKDMLLKSLGEESVDPDIIKLATGHPRFLFTITEETKEDLESDDGKSKGGKSRKGSRARSLSDLIMAIEAQTPYLSPMSSPPKGGSDVEFGKSKMYATKNNPLFETLSVEAELMRLRSSPPPKFKFLRDAEEKLYRRLLEEAQKSGIFQQEGILDNSLARQSLDEEKACFLLRNGGEKKMNKELLEEAQKSGVFQPKGILDNSLGRHSLDVVKDGFLMSNGGEKQEIIHCTTQVLPLDSHACDVLSRHSV